jgi:uncharacterized protein
MIANTWSGRTFDPLQPLASSICIEDIAHSLSLQSRFGHTDTFYSVAQHCVLVSHLVPAPHALAGLLHDAEEAYVGDVITPLKATGAMERFQLISETWRTVILHKFGLSGLLPESVTAIDHGLVINEARARMTHVPDWAAGSEPLPLTTDLHALLTTRLEPTLAESLFLRRFYEICEAMVGDTSAAARAGGELR